MSLLIDAQSHSCFNLPKPGLYHFSEEHRQGWSEFWHIMDGDLDKIVDWAVKAGIEDPEIWYNELHKFLFDVYSGDYRLLRKAAADNFQSFLASLANNHSNEPKDRRWYTSIGLLPDEFVRILESASELKDIRDVIHYINGRVPDLGFKLYEQFLLSRTGVQKKTARIISNLRKKAFEIEAEYGCVKLPQPGNVVGHINFPGEKFVVTAVVNKIITAMDENGKDCFFADPWNLDVLED